MSLAYGSPLTARAACPDGDPGTRSGMVVEKDLGSPSGQCRKRRECPVCDGTGFVLESIDAERLPVSVPCSDCQPFCATCRAWRPKYHHCEQPAVAAANAVDLETDLPVALSQGASPQC
jgi:hypothetical protein